MTARKRVDGGEYWGFKNPNCVVCNKKSLPGLFRCKKCHDQFVAEMPDEAPETSQQKLTAFNRIRRDMV